MTTSNANLTFLIERDDLLVDCREVVSNVPLLLLLPQLLILTQPPPPTADLQSNEKKPHSVTLHSL